MTNVMFFGMPWQFAAALVLFVIVMVVAVIKSAKMVSYFMYHKIKSADTWRPSQKDMIRKCNCCVLVKASQFAIYGFILVYLIRVEGLFSLSLLEMLKLLAIWYIPTICGIYLFAFIVMQIISINYINKQINK